MVSFIKSLDPWELAALGWVSAVPLTVLASFLYCRRDHPARSWGAEDVMFAVLAGVVCGPVLPAVMFLSLAWSKARGA